MVCISLTKELESTYLDEEGNIQFEGYLLEEIKKEKTPATDNYTGISEEALTTVLEKIY